MKEISLKQILHCAEICDIEEVGFTKITDFSYLYEELNYRVENNRCCEFEEHNLKLRTSTDSVMKNCKTIIAAVFPYFQGCALKEKKGYGRICASSVGTDYHIVVKRKLEDFVNSLKSMYDFSYKICVDSQELLDKEICKNAHLGFIGKNTLLINKKYGSFIFLGYILTDLDIKQEDIDAFNRSKPDRDECGDCTACIKNCPNSALDNEGKMNVKKCISYLTQTKENIPNAYRKNMGSQIYGCDMCQIKCPKNISIYGDFYENDDLYVNLQELLHISKKDFTNKFGHLAAAWRGKNIWKRNAIIAISNSENYELYNQIELETDDASAMIREYATWCIDELERKNHEK